MTAPDPQRAVAEARAARAMYWHLWLLADRCAVANEKDEGRQRAAWRVRDFCRDWMDTSEEELIAAVRAARAAPEREVYDCDHGQCGACPDCVTRSAYQHGYEQGQADAARAAALPPAGGAREPSEKAAEAYYRAAMADHLRPDEDIGDWGRNQVAHIKRRLADAYAVDFPAPPAGGAAGGREALRALVDLLETGGDWRETADPTASAWVLSGDEYRRFESLLDEARTELRKLRARHGEGGSDGE